MNTMNEIAKLFLTIQKYFKVDNWILTLLKEDMVNLNDVLTKNAFIETIYNGLVPVAIGLALIYALSNIIESAVYKEITVEDIIRELLRFCMIALFLNNGYEILSILVNLGSTIASEFMTASETVETTVETVDLNGAKSFLTLLMLAAEFFPNLLFLVFVSIPIKLVILVRSAEIMIYTALAPLALCDIQKNFSESQAFHFIKEYTALCLQGLIIVAIIRVAERIDLANILSVGNLLTLNSVNLCDILYAGVIIMLIFKSKKIAKSIVGL